MVPYSYGIIFLTKLKSGEAHGTQKRNDGIGDGQNFLRGTFQYERSKNWRYDLRNEGRTFE